MLPFSNYKKFLHLGWSLFLAVDFSFVFVLFFKFNFLTSGYWLTFDNGDHFLLTNFINIEVRKKTYNCFIIYFLNYIKFIALTLTKIFNRLLHFKLQIPNPMGLGRIRASLVQPIFVIKKIKENNDNESRE